MQTSLEAASKARTTQLSGLFPHLSLDGFDYGVRSIRQDARGGNSPCTSEETSHGRTPAGNNFADPLTPSRSCSRVSGQLGRPGAGDLRWDLICLVGCLRDGWKEGLNNSDRATRFSGSDKMAVRGPGPA